MAFQCAYSGVYEDPHDCTAFYVCDTNLQKARGSCSLLGTFSSDKLACVVGPCLDLSKDPLVTSSTTTTTTSSLRASEDGTLSTLIQTVITEVTTLTTNSTVTTSRATTTAGYGTDKDSIGTTTGLTTTPVTESTTTEPSTTTIACSSAGQTFADPNNCHKYYKCDSNLKLGSESCWFPSLQHYDSKSKTCVFGSC